MKYKSIRLVVQNTKSFIKGWSGRFCLAKGDESEVSSWHTLVEYPMKIRWREELGNLNKNRITNMRLCCELINNIIVKPRQIFSLQYIIGEPSAQRGFMIGPTIIDGKLNLDAGGGICQISTALFNTALRCNLRILEKHNHSSDIWGEKRIVDLGLDATYSFGRLDLKFENNFDNSIAIKMIIDEDKHQLKCSILTPVDIDLNIEVKSEIIRELYPRIGRKQHTYPEGLRKGWIVRTRRFVTNSGSRRYISYDRTEKYRPVILPVCNEHY
jgi:hypothetical protein